MSTITREDRKEDVKSIFGSFISDGFRTLISNGKRHFIIDTCFTDDNGNESMVFETSEKSLEDKNICWSDIDCINGFDDLEKVHNEMVQKWIDKLERGDV